MYPISEVRGRSNLRSCVVPEMMTSILSNELQDVDDSSGLTCAYAYQALAAFWA